MVGLEYGRVELRNHNKLWKKLADEKKREIKKLFGPIALEVTHIGSTAIKNIKSKPIIDMLVSVKSIDSVKDIIPHLEKLGYQHLPQYDTINQMLFIYDKPDKNVYSYYIHVAKKGSKCQRDYITFRDYLNINSVKRREYESLKTQLAEEYSDNDEEYNAKKSEYIQTLLREASLWRVLGKTVTVTVDKPFGSYSKKRNLTYKANYGYVYGMQSQDGEWLRAYIIGENKPVKRFTGKVVAVIEDKETKRTKLVVSPVNKIFYEPSIRNSVSFAEKDNDNEYICLYEKSCGAVVYFLKDDEPVYMLIRNRSKNIGFPKGHIELGENELDTAKREIFEETGLNVKIDELFREFYNHNISFFKKKQAVYYLAEADSMNVKIPKDEILSYHIENFDEAINLLTYPNERKILKKAHSYIIEKNNSRVY